MTVQRQFISLLIISQIQNFACYYQASEKVQKRFIEKRIDVDPSHNPKHQEKKMESKYFW